MSQAPPISLETTHKVLGWPLPADVTQPRGAGAEVFAALVREKVGRPLRSGAGASLSRIGVLMADPDTATSDPPLAIVVESESELATDDLRELQRLSWNFSHAPTVITIEPALLRVWTCCEPPDSDREIKDYQVECLAASDLVTDRSDELQAGAARALHWINLVSGQFFKDHSQRFDRDGRADQMLLGNLRHMRKKLKGSGLKDDDVCHDLLARVIFVQFLFHRKDQFGNPALTEAKLSSLQGEGVLEKRHASFDQVLSDYDDTYRLFDWLNSRFNGDLFPGKGSSPADRAAGWAREKKVVTVSHLSLLADFIRGDVDMPSGQLALWPQYAFDVIPLEFISCIYETFISDQGSQDGAYYTPSYVADFVLDRVLPWDGTKWDLKVLDPACGSGIFLVKSFQRLIQRWKRAHPDKPLAARILKRLLKQNIFGVDKDRHAVRVACFSLYLAMCDEIEPRHYWTQVKFPPMRGRRLICADFFSESHAGFRTKKNGGSFDLVVGNAPFGEDVITKRARSWANSDRRSWSIPNNDIGGLFLAKSAQLVTGTGKIALIQSANTLLFNLGKAAQFRKELFSGHYVEAVYNLSALRHLVFKRRAHTKHASVAPVCVIVLNRRKPEPADRITYVSPKNLRQLLDEFVIVVEPGDSRRLTVDEAIADAAIWSKLMWGSHRDLQLIRRLGIGQNLEQLEAGGSVKARQGVNFGDREKPAPYYNGRKMFDKGRFPAASVVWLETADLPIVQDDLRVDSRASTNTEAFARPQLLIKHSWTKNAGRFQARACPATGEAGILCNQSYMSVHATEAIVESACLAHNSKIAVYYHFLTSGRFGAYRPKLSKSEILGLPIPEPRSGLLDGLDDYDGLDRRAYEVFALKEAERVLVEDAIEYTLDGYLNGDKSKGKQPTLAGDEDESDALLQDYCRFFIRVLRAGFGIERSIAATVFRRHGEDVPYRLVAFALGVGSADEIEVRDITSGRLLRELERIGHKDSGTSAGAFSQQVFRVYESNNGVPTIFVIKPDQKRFWTRSMGLNDGDEVSLDLFRWKQGAVAKGGGKVH